MAKYLIASIPSSTTPAQPTLSQVVTGCLISAANGAAALVAFAADYPAKAAVIAADPTKEAQAFDFTALTPQLIAQAEEGLTTEQIDAFRGPMPDWFKAKRGIV